MSVTIRMILRSNTKYPCLLQVHNATNSNQKEKYEADLKKEIKKLQVTFPGVLVGVCVCS